MESLQISVQEITPEIAKEMLKGDNSHNRKISQRHVNALAGQMSKGHWVLTHQPIAVSATGKILDGQHRLEACIQSDKTIVSYVAVNCDEGTFQVIDTGKSRSGADALTMFGVNKYPIQVAAMIRWIIQYQRGYFSDNVPRAAEYISNSEILDFHKENEGIQHCMDVIAPMYRNNKIIPLSVLSAAYFLVSKIDQEKADNFFNMVCYGTNLKIGSAAKALRDKFIDKQVRRVKMGRKEQGRTLIKAWNLFYKGASVQRIVLSKSGINKFASE